MEYCKLNGTDLNVSRICLGTWQFNAGASDITWSPQDEKTSRDIFNKALECGINFFDTAEAYTNSEAVLGRCIQGKHREDLIIGSKFGQKHPQGKTEYSALDIENALTKSLATLQTSYIDLYQIHWPTMVESMESAVEQLELEKRRGRIRHYGLCNFGAKNMSDFQKANGKAVSTQLPYNLLWRPIEYSILPKARELNLSVLAYSALQQGLLTGKFHTVDDVPEGRRRTRFFSSQSTALSKHGGAGAERETFDAIDKIRKVCEDEGHSMTTVALSWLLAQDSVASVIVGCSNVEQVKTNTHTVKLSQETLKKLNDATDELKYIFGDNPDLWAPDSRMA